MSWFNVLIWVSRSGLYGALNYLRLCWFNTAVIESLWFWRKERDTGRVIKYVLYILGSLLSHSNHGDVPEDPPLIMKWEMCWWGGRQFLVAAVVWGNVTGIHCCHCCHGLSRHRDCCGDHGFLEGKGSNSASASRVQYYTFYDSLQWKWSLPSVVLADWSQCLLESAGWIILWFLMVEMHLNILISYCRNSRYVL